ncbi:transcription termination factor MTERF15, mitochondrial [Heracleum sosnowskyi]|uniref:Transcription termination factor MTERF15, mitochondrial n=1 Tax=Heracleum sosnowskyi TaxID=360622 RepID=A0AAD8HU63_9APIA|nr:transcription termination factor MTERF15, mitochondrial [Heracleum sosnowskyi]
MVLSNSHRKGIYIYFKVVYSCPTVLEFEFLKRWKMGFKEIGVLGFSSLAIKNVLEVCRKFDLDPCNVSRWVESFRGLGFSDDTVCKVLEVNPMVIMASEEVILDKVRFLEKIGLERRGIDWVFGEFPAVLSYGMENRLIPLMSEFQDLGISRGEVKKEIVRDPRVLGLEVGELSQCLRMLRSLKCRFSVKEEIFKDGILRAGYKVKLRVDCLCKYGLIRREAFGIIWREPRVILYDMKDIERKIDFLIKEMKFDVQWLLEVPEYLGISFEKQIVPRYNVIEYLRSKEQVNLKIQHPVGMWKLFKPQKYAQSKEDAKNIRSFMEPLGQAVSSKSKPTSMEQMQHGSFSSTF